MEFPKYTYIIGDDKYDARIAFFKYVSGLYTALIAASLIGFERLTAVIGKEVAVGTDSVSSLIICVVILVLAIVQTLLVLGLSYHHKFYNARYLAIDTCRYENMKGKWYREIFGVLVYIKHVLAVLETYGVIALAGTWFILPMVALYYLAKAYYGLKP